MTSVPAAAPRKIAGLVLAAGESSRMGRDKALLTYRGHTFLETIVSKLREASLDRIAVVLGHNAEAIQRAVDLQEVEVAINHHYRRGQTLSLQVGLNALQDAAQVLDAIILCLVDHPAFEPTTVATLIAEFGLSPAPVVIPSYRGRRGHPVLVANSVFKPLLALEADQGANSVIRAFADEIRTIDVEDPGILVDVDDPESYHALSRTA